MSANAETTSITTLREKIDDNVVLSFGAEHSFRYASSQRKLVAAPCSPHHELERVSHSFVQGYIKNTSIVVFITEMLPFWDNDSRRLFRYRTKPE